MGFHSLQNISRNAKMWADHVLNLYSLKLSSYLYDNLCVCVWKWISSDFNYNLVFAKNDLFYHSHLFRYKKNRLSVIIIIIIIIIIINIFIIIIIIILIITLKSAIRDWLQSPDCAANCLHHARVVRAQLCANHIQHVVLCHLVRRDSSAIKFDRVWNRIYFSFMSLAETIDWWRRGGNWSARRKPLMTSFRKCHI